MPKAKTTTTTKQLCVRCPDHPSADSFSHQNDFAKCLKQYPTTPVPIKNKQGLDTGESKGAKYTANELWWGFNDGPNTLDLSDASVCKELLEVAKAAGSKHQYQLNMSDAEEQIWYTKTVDAKQQAVFQDVPITKGMLEEAVMKVYAPKTEAEKKVEKDRKKQEAALKKNAIVDAVKNTAQSLKRTESTDAVNTSAMGQSGDLQYRPNPGSTSDPSATNRTDDSNGNSDGDHSDKQLSQQTGGAGDDKDSDGNQAGNVSQKAVPATAISFTRYCPANQSHRNQKGTTDMPHQVPTPQTRPLDDPPAHNQLRAFTAAIPAIQQDHASLVSAAVHLQESDTTSKQPLEYHELRDCLATLNDSYQVLSNHFTVTIPKDKALFEYHVLGMPDKVTRPKRRVLILDMIECDQTLYANRQSIVTDYRKKIISYVPLFTDDQVTAGTDVAQVAVPNYNPGTRDQPMTQALTLRFVARHDLNGLRDFVAGRDESYKDSGAAEAMNIVIAKAVADGSPDTFQVGNNRFYYRPGWKDLQNQSDVESSGLVGIRGYYSAIKPAMGAVLLNVNTVTSAFYKAQTLDKYLDHFYKFGWFPGDPQNSRITHPIESYRLLEKAQKHLSGLRVWVDFERSQPGDQDNAIDSPNRRTKTLAELGTYPQFQQFPDEAGQSVSVWKHITKKYPQAVKQGDDEYPTGNVGRKAPGPRKYYLARQLKVLSDQMYRGFPLPPDVTASMIDIARRRPDANYRAILGEGVASLGLHNASLPPMLQGLGISISRNMIRLPARMITNPKIMYKRDFNGINVTTGQWRVNRNTQFLNTVHGFSGLSTKGVATVQFFKPRGRMEYDQHKEKYLINWYNMHNLNGIQKTQALNASKPYEEISNWDEDSLKQYFQKFQGKLHLAILIFPNQSKENRERYATFKIVMDQHLGMKSICFNETKMVKSLRNFNPARDVMMDGALVDYIRNIAMKLNLRCGNFNHTVRQQDLPKIGGSTCSTMILGADVTHPGSGSLRGTPSIAAVVGSIDNQFGLLPASMRLNPPRQEIIADMEQMVYERLAAWSANNNQTLPASILYYRDGVGDSMYATVRATELLHIRSAWDKLCKQRYPNQTLPKLKLTAVVVTKRHHTRLYPRNMAGPREGNPLMTKSGNCPPGTVVDSGITSPYYFDFYLQSHNILQGSAKPAHYFVLENGMGFTAQELQDLTYSLCHTYGKSTTAVSYAPPAYYADRLCERGRLYLKPLLDGAQQHRNLTEAQIWTLAEGFFYRGGGAVQRGNPWHAAHEGKMFWM
ncbi:hypothetical protein LTR36_001500 [Oleoguttula mirabilis]|uniref:Piwi domain-containing protein n=1 Tax=Oleoguttula mirabilis TaxID=1507867 RepID=A0AAV9JN33_9PEZI|nr:hypothetical protein LTR36_001500 [Oleoguttula mirabilis]